MTWRRGTQQLDLLFERHRVDQLRGAAIGVEIQDRFDRRSLLHPAR
jgi:hypothetical protein